MSSVLEPAIMFGPLVLAVVALRLSPRRRWVLLVLAAPAVLLGLAIMAVIVRDGVRYPAGWFVLLYGPLLFFLGALGLLRWRRRRGKSDS